MSYATNLKYLKGKYEVEIENLIEEFNQININSTDYNEINVKVLETTIILYQKFLQDLKDIN